MSQEELGSQCGFRLVEDKLGCVEEELQEVRGPDEAGPGKGSGLLLCVYQEALGKVSRGGACFSWVSVGSFWLLHSGEGAERPVRRLLQ